MDPIGNSTKIKERMMSNRPETYLAWNGKTYPGAPPAEWYKVEDGRWWPARWQQRSDGNWWPEGLDTAVSDASSATITD